MNKATMLNIMISHPSDVKDEVQCAKNVIQRWNSSHATSRQIVLVPKHWEDDTYSSFGDSGQDIINKQLIDESDIVIAIFRHKLGTPTKHYDSGTVEEIFEALKLKKQVFVFFLSNHIDSSTQREPRLVQFQNEIAQNCLYAEYIECNDFETKLYSNIEKYINKKFLKKDMLDKSYFSNGDKEWLTLWAENELNLAYVFSFFNLLSSIVIGNDGYTPKNASDVKEFKEFCIKMQQLGFAEKGEHRNLSTTYKLTQRGYQYYLNNIKPL